MGVMTQPSLVRWREWNDASFLEAKTQDKPVLLHIGAVWCHWCHVMDRGVPGDPTHTGVYSNPQLAEYVNEHFIPVRVDNDQRPDINARYNQGGWPTTSFLTPDGDVIYGGTYFAPGQMRQLLPQISKYWSGNKAELLRQISERGETDLADVSGVPGPGAHQVSEMPVQQIVDRVGAAINRGYDQRNFGLGDGQKFPMSDAWAFLLATQHPDNEHLDMVVNTLIAMGTRGMFDLAAGGWFRYSTTPDWTVPHFEKMLEDHARLIPVYLQAIQCCRVARPDQMAVLEKIVRASLQYLETTLLHDADGVTYFAGSQDADEVYYALSLAERATLPAPFIDWRMYADWNALMVPALNLAALVLSERRYHDLAHKLLGTITRLCVNPDGSVTHAVNFENGAPTAASLRGMLGDQAAVACALFSLDAAEIALPLLAFAQRALAATDGGYYDYPADPAARGMLRVRIKPIFDNAHMADALLIAQYFGAIDAGEYVTAARRTLAAFSEEYVRYREHGAAYALACMRASAQPTEIMIVGTAEPCAPFVQAAFARYDAWRLVRVLDPARDAAFIADRGYPVTRTPVAFVCRGTSCSAPIYDPLQLIDMH